MEAKDFMQSLNRGRKAFLLVQALRNAGVTYEVAVDMAPFNWETAEERAGVRASSSETRAIALGILAQWPPTTNEATTD